MKKFLLLILSITLFSCETPEIESVKQSTESMSKIGDVTKTPDLYIPEAESGWKGYGIRPDGTYGEIDETIGVRVPNYKKIYNPQLAQDSYAVISPYGYPMLNYSCYIANGAPIDYSGQNDFVVDRVADGIPEEQYGDYNFPGMLSIVTFQNGLPIGEVIKQSFWVAPTNEKLGFDNLQAIEYDATNPNMMYIWAGTADLYFNKARVNQGKNLIVITINPLGEINESNYNNNVSTLPVNVDLNTTINNWSGVGVLDLTAIDENHTIPPSNVVVTKTTVKGKRYVKLDWDCPYHMPFYVKHWFTVKRNGVVIYDKEDLSEFTDKLQGNPQIVNYTITTTVPGLGQSTPVNVTVTR